MNNSGLPAAIATRRARGRRGLVRTGIAIGLGPILRAPEGTINIWITWVFWEMDHSVNLSRDPRLDSSYHEGPFDSTSTFPYRVGADSAEEKVNAMRTRTVRFLKERCMMIENICMMKKI
jgi:hypothetical protein